MTDLIESTRDHWWWRPGWRIGRSHYTWHITFESYPAVHQLAGRYADFVRKFPTLDAVAISGLHLTMQGIGFSDEVSLYDIERITAAAQVRCRNISPLNVTIGPATMDAEGVYLPVAPSEAVAALRMTLRDAIGDVWGQDNIPELADGFHPHVTLAYSNSSGPAEPIKKALDVYQPASTHLLISTATLIDLNRDNKRYEWTDIATVNLG